MNPLRIGIIGLGNAGMLHLKAIQDGCVPDAVVTAVCCPTDRSAELSDALQDITVFEEDQALIDSGICDAVIIATPHPLHPQQTIAALRAGLHVLCEKPAGLCASEARAMTEAARESGCVYTLNFNRRTSPMFQKVHELVHEGTIGQVQRACWTSTGWLRVQSYFDTSPWRGTWAGEGGGLLLNQFPHILDLWQWILGMPQRLLAHCAFGRHHRIEVEDEIHVLAEYPSGAMMTLIGSTGESPGFERLEIVGDRATVVAEADRLTLTRLAEPVGSFIRSAPAGFDRPEAHTEHMQLDVQGDLAAGITQDFVESIRTGRPPMVPGEAGIAGLELANAILLSSWQDRWVHLPVDQEVFDRHLQQRRRRSRQRNVTSAVMELQKSFSNV